MHPINKMDPLLTTTPTSSTHSERPALRSAGTAKALTQLAHQKVIAALRAFGNGISEQHSKALHDLMMALSFQGLGIAPGRFAYGLPCGAGKTQSVVAWIAASVDLNLGLAVAVSASQIMALGRLKRDLILAGVPEPLIGLRHSKSRPELARALEQAAETGLTLDLMRDTGDADRPIMLVSHQRIRGASEAPAFCMHEGKPRDLLIWDETLMTTDATTLSWREVEASIGLVLPRLTSGSNLTGPLQQALELLAREVERQQEAQPAATLHLFPATDLESAREELVWVGGYGSKLHLEAVRTVKALLTAAQRPLGIALTSNGPQDDGLISYKVAVDEELENIAVLDASHPVRLLARNGDVTDRTTAAMRNCKTYERVTVRQMNVKAGKSTLSDRKKLRGLAAQAATSINELPLDEAVLVFTHKGDDERTMLANLRSDLQTEGVDLKAAVGGRPRISFLTWGSETSISTYSHCKHVFLVGILRRSLRDLAASMAGERQDLSYRMSRNELLEVQSSEMAHCVLQAMNRGTCRTVDAAGAAGAMTLTILDGAPALRDVLAPVLPGVNWEQVSVVKPSSKAAAVASGIRRIMDSQPDSVRAVSLRSVKAELKSEGLHFGDDTWLEGRNAAILALGLPIRSSRWILRGQSMVRQLQ